MKDVKIEMLKVGGDNQRSGEIKEVLGRKQTKVNHRERTKIIALVGITISSIFIGFVFLPMFSPVLFHSFRSDSKSYGVHAKERFGNLPNNGSIKDIFSWTPLEIAFGLEILTQFVISFTLLRSTKTNVDPNVRLSNTQLWLTINAFLLIFDCICFLFKLEWYIFGAIIIVARMIMLPEVDDYSSTLETKIAKAAESSDDVTESPLEKTNKVI